MKICAITMVYRDYWALAQWYRHYARHLGATNLYVVAHGADPKVRDICSDASIITVPRDSLKGFDRVRGRMLNGFQSALLAAYDWVIRTDADELICLDPAHHASFADLLAAETSPAMFALGLNVAEVDGDDALADAEPALSARTTAIFSGHYSKAWAVSDRVALMRHGVQVRPRKVAAFPYRMPEGVYLAHLKYANVSALEVVNADRRKVANRKERGVPGTAWKRPAKEAAKFFAKVADLPETPWHEASSNAYSELSVSPMRDTDTGLIRTRNIRFGYRTQLPDWFKTC